MDYSPLWLTIRVASTATFLLLLLGLPGAWWISSGSGPLRSFLRLAVTFPLVMPPTVLGFLFLVVFAPSTLLGRLLDSAGLGILFTTRGLVLASVAGGIPFVFNPLISGFESLPPSLSEAARVLGKGRLEILARVLLPSMLPSLMSATALSFAHSCGEFGVVLMVGGKIPGQTTTASLALFDAVDTMDMHASRIWAVLLLGLSAAVLFPALTVGRRLAARNR
ncbi:MAG TPA: molybdate ABC transporter permease subunit [Fibrobacteria bacterium]|nr:molybdate ABC transporter permease subunit [Fibrobacteria bacterium]